MESTGTQGLHCLLERADRSSHARSRMSTERETAVRTWASTCALDSAIRPLEMTSCFIWAVSSREEEMLIGSHALCWMVVYISPVLWWRKKLKEDVCGPIPVVRILASPVFLSFSKVCYTATVICMFPLRVMPKFSPPLTMKY